MGFINTCNNPLNPKLHISNAMCIWEPDIKTFPTPSPRGEIFEDNDF